MNDIATSMDRAVKAFQRGDFATARDIAARALKSQPSNVNIMQFLGIAQAQAGDKRAGLATLQHALRLNPHNRQLRLNAARAALDAGLAAMVADLCKPMGNDPHAVQLLAEADKLAGNAGDAMSTYARLADLQPNDGKVLNNYGNALLEAGETERAVEVLERAAFHMQDEPQIWLNLGRANSILKRFDRAEIAFDRAIALNPTDAQVNFELGKSLFRHGKAEQALIRLSEAARGGILEPQVFVLIGLCYVSLDQREQAEQAYRMALRRDPTYDRAILTLAILYEQGNQLEALRDLYEEARDRNLTGANITYIEALVLRREGNLQAALELAQQTMPEGVDSIVRSQFIGQVADQLGDTDTAFAAFSDMNAGMATKPEALRYDGTEHRRFIQSRTGLVTSDWFESWKPVEIADDRADPVFLTGFLRSGTTLLDTILMGHPDTDVREEEEMVAVLERQAGPIENLGNLDDPAIGKMRDSYFAEAAKGGALHPDKMLIDKYPLATLRASFIHRAFPDARFIFALRHPCDVVLSCWMQNFRVTRAMASFLTLENAVGMYAAAMEHWMQAREILPLRVHTVRYEDMISDLQGEMRPLLDFLNLEWDDRILDYRKTASDRGYIRTPSYAQVTEKMYSRASGRWQRYRPQLAPILDTLAPWAIRFGYPDPRDI
ncbi:tetratricopeptide repeat-containing sulfotransferase family protein [Croceicoccus naphthovorans]|uniref:Uncharacterized protein n=1 Tax=Croceicoccus naphthovorans TaxID=1348774 RepID=A0A0G3XJM2_9SPHN|nr:tetratricopeptide repeat-containing sulfotransferase family protein [Croceicoccus naphthovorans]AKM10799.1 hypothetical protein AB433_13825 [Croceicoccus naphthovorans]MBB3989006.1 tetratricopeptide (TPR) repeat protein [Croceicoccus naphthovorans]